MLPQIQKKQSVTNCKIQTGYSVFPLIKRPGYHPGSVIKAAHQRACSSDIHDRPIPSGSEAQGKSVFFLYTSTVRYKRLE